MKKLVLLAVIAAGLAYFGAKWHLHSKVSESMDQLVMMASPFAKIQYSGVRSTFGGELTVEGVTVVFNEFNDPLVIERIGIDTRGFLALLKMSDVLSMQSSKVPDYFGFIVENVRVPSDADYYRKLYAMLEELDGREIPDDPALTCAGQYGLSPAFLDDLGYEEQVFSLRFSFQREAAGLLMHMDQSTENMWQASLDMQIAGDFAPGQVIAGSYRPRMKSLRLEYTDDSLNERIRKNCERRGLTDEQIIAAQLETFKQYGIENGIEFDEYVLEPYLEFLKGKDTLVITAEPREPIALSQIDLYKPSDVPALLQLEASAY